MPSNVPRALEPYKKRGILDQRCHALRRAIASGTARASILRLAARVRDAQLGVIKAQRLLIKDRHLLFTDSPSPQIARQLANLAKQEARWRKLTEEQIVAESSRSGTPCLTPSGRNR